MDATLTLISLKRKHASLLPVLVIFFSFADLAAVDAMTFTLYNHWWMAQIFIVHVSIAHLGND